MRTNELTRAIFRRYQNSFCLFICICITVVSAALMLFTALSSFGNRSTMRRLHTSMVLLVKMKTRYFQEIVEQCVCFLVSGIHANTVTIQWLNSSCLTIRMKPCMQKTIPYQMIIIIKCIYPFTRATQNIFDIFSEIF